MRMAVVEASLPSRRVDAEEPVERAEPAGGAQDGNQPEKGPPAQAVHTEEEDDASTDKPHRSVIGAYVCFHGELDFA